MAPTPTEGWCKPAMRILYGTTFSGGTNSCAVGLCGTFFSLLMGLDSFVSFVDSSGNVGQSEGILGQGLTGTAYKGMPEVVTSEPSQIQIQKQ
jgi:hypothetical protein